MSIKRQLLDPIGTMCKLVSLIFTELNTKISIQDHVLTLHRPNNYQFLIRLYNGDGRENISELYNVIIRIIKWYLVPTPPSQKVDGCIVEDISDGSPPTFTQYIYAEMDNGISGSPGKAFAGFNNWFHISSSEEIKKIVRYTCEAFRQLQKTYDSGNVILALQYFIILLEDGIEGKFDENKIPRHFLETVDQYETLLDYNKLKNLWEIKKLKQVCELYDLCFALKLDTYDEKTGLINGYLSSINSILDTTDTEFQKLVHNSNNG